MWEEKNGFTILRTGALGSLFATVALVALFALAQVGGQPHPLQMVLDDLFILGWIAGWLGLAALVGRQHPAAGSVVLFFGLAGAVLDFTENQLLWATDGALTSGWGVLHDVARRLSYLLPFAGGAVAGLMLWSDALLNRLVGLTGTVLAGLGVVGLYLEGEAGTLLSGGWFLVWFALIGALLWREAEREVHDDHT